MCFNKAAFLSGLRFLVHPFIMELLNHFKIALGQLIPNSWSIVVSCMEIWLATIEGDMIRVNEFTFLYPLKESKEYGYYELVPWVKEARIVGAYPRRSDTRSPDSFLSPRMNGRPPLVKFGETSLGCSVGGEPRV